MITIPRRKQKLKFSRKNACKNLQPKGDISNSLQPLCICIARELILGTRAYVCQVCSLYDPSSNKYISDVFEESRKIAEKKIKEEKIELEGFELEKIEKDEVIDLSLDEFEEVEDEIPVKYEKRKAGKSELEEGEELQLECPFCGEYFDDLASHVQSCEFAPDDVSMDDILPSKPKKKKKRKMTKSKSTKVESEEDEEESEEEKVSEKNKCPYCGKQFQRLGRHLKACKKKPKKKDEEDEEEDDEDFDD